MGGPTRAITLSRTISGLLVDLDYLVVDEKKPVVRLWIREGRESIQVLDENFEPYFYVIPSPEYDLGQLAEEIGGVEYEGVAVKRVETISLREGLDQKPMLKVYTHLPGDVPKLRSAIRHVVGVESVREADIPYVCRYLIDKDLSPSKGVLVHAQSRDGAWWATEDPVNLDSVDSQVVVLAFDIEVYNPHVNTNPDRDPVIMVGVATNTGFETCLKAEADGEKTSDKEVLESFVECVKEVDPDIICGYNSDNYDWPYIIKRAKKNRVELSVGRDGSTPSSKPAGRIRKIKIVGRANVDLYKVVERDLPDVKLKTLENVSEHLGVVKHVERVNIPKDMIWAYWDDPEKRETLRKYSLDDVRSALGLAERLLPLQAEFSQLTHVPLDDIPSMGRGRQVESYLLYEAHRRGIVAPNRRGVESPTTYKGGFVLTPKKGIHEDVVCLDFASMYPNIMLSYNISPDTFCPNCGDDEAYVAPEVGYKFRKSPRGFFSDILANLIEKRAEMKAQLRSMSPESSAYKTLQVKQQALKTLTNSFYGYMGWQVARWYQLECAEATTAWGRHTIKNVIQKARDMGIEVLYGDTDSLFCKNSPKVEVFVREVNREYPLELEYKGVYRSIFFTSKKKRYAGLLDDGTIDIKGFEVQRGDWSELAKEVQEKVISHILVDKSPRKAVEYVRRVVEELRDRRVPLEKLVIYKTLTKSLKDYKSKQAHVIVAEKLSDMGYVVEAGSKIAFVVTRGQGKMSENAEPIETAKLEEVDTNYYIENQVIPTAHRILEHFGYTPEDYRGTGKQATLTSFM